MFNLCTAVSTLNIGTNVEAIPSYAFQGCSNIQTVNFNATNCTIAGRAVFNDNIELTTFNIGSNVKTIPAIISECKSLKSLTIPNSVTTIGESAFCYCTGLTAVTIGDKVKSIGKYAFYECHGLISITIPNSITNIEEETFRGCSNLISITLPNKLKSIGAGAFFGCGSLSSITLPNGIKSIGASAFLGCNFSSIILPNNITNIEFGALWNCKNLTSVTIPSGVTNIAAIAFRDCSKLSTVKCYAKTPPSLNGFPFFNVPVGSCVLKVPTSAVTKYKQAEIWKDFIIQGGGVLVYPKPADPEKGFVNGNELYDSRAIATVEAFAHEGYKFANWTKNGVVVSTANPYSFTVTEDVELVANFDGVGIVETHDCASLQVYPNPTTGELTIDISDMRYETSNMRYEIFDIYGKKLISDFRFSDIGKSEIKINIAHLPSGIYFLKISTEVGDVVKKILKM